MSRERNFLYQLDQALEAAVAPLGFRRTRAKRLERVRKDGETIDVIEIQRGRGILIDSFAVNLRIEPGPAPGAARPLAGHRLGSWPESTSGIVHVLLLSPPLHLLLPIFWVALFTDRWWRIPKSNLFTRLTQRNVLNTVASSGEQWFQHVSTA